MVRTSFCYFVWSVGLFCLLSLSATLYWSEQSAKFNHFVSEKTSISSESDKVFVSNVLDIAVRPWPNDPECGNFTIEFYRNEARPLMALVSYPGSGNTWIRGIIERLSGYFTGSVYTAKNLFMTGNTPSFVICKELFTNEFDRFLWRSNAIRMWLYRDTKDARFSQR